MENKYKCFTEEHEKIDAKSFCPECKIYMCNKCENIHSSFFKNHHSYNLNKEEDIFIGICKEKNHYELKYFCKTHNQLCCSACLCKLNKKGEGQHKDCDVCYIDNIEDDKKNKLKENIKSLEELQIKFNQSIEEIKTIFQNIEKDKENLKLEIQNIFTKIRNILNEREDKLLLEVDNLFNSKYFNEDIIKIGENLPKKIKLSLEKGKLIDKEWDNKNIYSNINDCINIENNIGTINKIKEKIDKYNIKNKTVFRFIPKDNQLNSFYKIINSLGKIYYNNFSFRECPSNIKEDRKYIVGGNNNNILTKTGTDRKWMGTICKYELDKSIEEHKWKIKILNSLQNAIMVGVAPIDFDIHSSSYNTCGWYLYCYDSPPALYSGPPFNYNHFKTNLENVNNEIIIVLNFVKKTLKFIINDLDGAESYKNIPLEKPLFPVVCMYNKDDSIEITEL